MRALDHSTNDDVIQEVGAVRAVEDGRLVVHTGGSTFRCKRAVSCLVEPQIDDVVLFAGRSSGDLYVLAVLEREDDAVTLVAPGDLTLKVDAGRFAVASEGIDLIARDDVSLTSAELQVRASRGHVFVKRLEYLGERLFGETAATKLVTGKLERVAEVLVDRLERSYRFVKDMDQLRAGHIEHVAEETVRLKGQNAFLQADQLTKVDGDQIHLG
ncbi:MAG: DUF3540 domain-containing protein [Sandaracinaceae bacterium]